MEVLEKHVSLVHTIMYNQNTIDGITASSPELDHFLLVPGTSINTVLGQIKLQTVPGLIVKRVITAYPKV